MTAIPDVSWPRIAAFVRQHTHDLRNELNGLDLEAALLADIVTEPEAREGVARMRAEIRKVAAELRVLSTKFADARPSPLRLPAQELFLIWQDQVRELAVKPEVEWTSALGGEQVNVDPMAVAAAFREILANAQAFGTGAPLHASARVADDRVVFELREPKPGALDPAQWGRTPFVSSQRGRYGLGLCGVLSAINASRGEIAWSFDAPAAELVTTVSFPIA